MVLYKSSLCDLAVLRQRVITAVALGAGILSCILFLPGHWLALIFALVTLLAAWEWAGLIELPGNLFKAVYVIAVAVLLFAAWVYEEHARTVFLIAVFWWVACVILVAVYESSWLHAGWLWGLLGLSGFVVLVPTWLGLVHLHGQGPGLLIYLMALVSVADSAAYFAGHRFGKTKLAPELSPGKTREGLWGALLACLVFAIIGVYALGLDKAVWVYFVCLSLICVLLAAVGDLYESLLKRRAGAKDSGTILPGHGGVLDRIDGLTAAAPSFMFGVYWFHG